MKWSCLLLVLGILPAATMAQSVDARMHLPDGVEWAEIVPGLSFGSVYGTWSEEAHGKYVRMNPGFESPMHTHSGAYHGVVISGTITNPYAGEDQPARMEPGTYWFVPGGAAHVTACVSEEPCLFYTHSDGGWDLEVTEE